MRGQEAPFSLSFSSVRKSHLFKPRERYSNVLNQSKAQKLLSSAVKLFILPLIQSYKKKYVESPEIHKKVTDFLGRDVNTDVKNLTGFEKKEYLRYQKLFSEKQIKPYSSNLPWIPHMLRVKPHVVNFQEAIDYFKSLYISEAKKAASSSS